jgi:hypothetical protein
MTLRALEPPFAIVLICATPSPSAALHLLFRPYLAARPKAAVGRPGMRSRCARDAVAMLAGTVTTVSSHVGPAWSGVLAALPIVLSSLIVMLQPRIGGPAMAAVIANSALGLLGFGLAIGSVHLSAVALGSWPALALGLAICIVWNLGLMGIKRGAGLSAAMRRRRAADDQGECRRSGAGRDFAEDRDGEQRSGDGDQRREAADCGRRPAHAPPSPRSTAR